MKEKKKAHGIQLLIRAVVRDPDGKIITDTGNKPAKSFVIAFLKFIYGLFTAPANVSVTETDGSSGYVYQSGQTTNNQFYVLQVGGYSQFGVVVGTGDTAETNTDYQLETQLTEGLGLGNITHGDVVVGPAAVVGANVDLEVKRVFTNLTGSSIVVKEAGIYTSFFEVGFHCIVRDVLSGTVTVPDKCSLTVIYTVRTTV